MRRESVVEYICDASGCEQPAVERFERSHLPEHGAAGVVLMAALMHPSVAMDVCKHHLKHIRIEDDGRLIVYHGACECSPIEAKP